MDRLPSAPASQECIVPPWMGKKVRPVTDEDLTGEAAHKGNWIMAWEHALQKHGFAWLAQHRCAQSSFIASVTRVMRHASLR